TGHFDSSLQRRGIVWRRLPLRMRESETLKTQIVDRSAGAPNDTQHLRQSGRDDLAYLFSRSWQVVEHSASAIQIPFARSVERLKNIFDPIRPRPASGKQSKQAGTIKSYRPRLCIDAFNWQPIVQPPGNPNDLHILQIAPASHD